MALKISNAAATGGVTDTIGRLDNGYLRMYGGTRATTVDTALSGQTLLAELRFHNPAALSITNGVATFDTITGDTNTPASGTATWFRAWKADGTTAVIDGDVGLSGSGADLILDNTSLIIHSTVNVSSLTLTEPTA